jgi:arylsulfatase A-like enzyme
VGTSPASLSRCQSLKIRLAAQPPAPHTPSSRRKRCHRLPIGLEEPLSSASTRDIGMPPSHPTLPSLLKAAGYNTTLIGKWHLGKLPNYGPLKSGYDRFFGFRGGSLDYFTHKSGPPHTDTHDLWDGDVKIHQLGYLTDLLGDRAVSEINSYARSGQPFLISLHFNAPHWPWRRPTTSRKRAGSPRCSTSTAARSAPTRAWSCIETKFTQMAWRLS